MNSRMHLYYINVSDVQRVAVETIGRRLNDKELDRVRDKVLDRIQWYDPIEESIREETKTDSM